MQLKLDYFGLIKNHFTRRGSGPRSHVLTLRGETYGRGPLSAGRLFFAKEGLANIASNYLKT